MSKRLTFENENGKMVIKFDGHLIPAEKTESLFDILAADMDRCLDRFQTAAADLPNGPLILNSAI